MSKMMTPKDKVGRVVFLSEIISDARNASSCCVGAEANLERLATQSRQPEIYTSRKRWFTDRFKKLISTG